MRNNIYIGCLIIRTARWWLFCMCSATDCLEELGIHMHTSFVCHTDHLGSYGMLYMRACAGSFVDSTSKKLFVCLV